MPRYVCSETYYFRELGRRVQPNEVIDLPEETFEHFKKSHPGLLKPAMLNTMAEVPVVRSSEASEGERAPKRRGRKAKN
jgi:hypothetical protein